jgi:addiction module HigA family antidote
MKRRPDPPGTILREKFMKPLKITRQQLADHLGWSLKQVDRICDNESKITPEKAVKLGNAFQTSPRFWLKLQNIYELWHLRKNFIYQQPLIDKTESNAIIKDIKFTKVRFGSNSKYHFKEFEIGECWEFKNDPKKLRNQQMTIHQTLRRYNMRHGLNIAISTAITDNVLRVWRVK